MRRVQRELHPKKHPPSPLQLGQSPAQVEARHARTTAEQQQQSGGVAGDREPSAELDADAEEHLQRRGRQEAVPVQHLQGGVHAGQHPGYPHAQRAAPDAGQQQLQDLAMTGQIDLSKPLIEQPESLQSPKQSSPLPGGGEKTSPTPPSPGLGTGSQGMTSCPKCGALFGSQDQLSAHQQLYCMFAAPMAIFQAAQEPGQAKSPPPRRRRRRPTVNAQEDGLAHVQTPAGELRLRPGDAI
jgi:hypothetical protein